MTIARQDDQGSRLQAPGFGKNFPDSFLRTCRRLFRRSAAAANPFLRVWLSTDASAPSVSRPIGGALRAVPSWRARARGGRPGGALYRLFRDRDTDGWFIDAIVD